MAQPSPPAKKFGPALDPDSIPETLCNGPFHISPGALSIITFTNTRAQAAPLFDGNTIVAENIVRARIVLTRDTLIAFRNLLNELLPPTGDKEPPPIDISGGSSSIH